MKHFLQYTKGFTLIESLVAVAMLSLVIISVMGLAQSSIAANNSAQVQVSANYLAGEAIEYIRNIRDMNIKNGDDWLTSIPQQCFQDRGCDVDTINDNFINPPCHPNNGCPPLKFTSNTDSGFYHHGSGGTDSQFTRTVKIERITNEDEGGNDLENEIAVRVSITSDVGYFKLSPLLVVEHMFNFKKEAQEEQQQGDEQQQQSQS